MSTSKLPVVCILTSDIGDPDFGFGEDVIICSIAHKHIKKAILHICMHSEYIEVREARHIMSWCGVARGSACEAVQVCSITAAEGMFTYTAQNGAVREAYRASRVTIRGKVLCGGARQEELKMTLPELYSERLTGGRAKGRDAVGYVCDSWDGVEETPRQDA